MEKLLNKINDEIHEFQTNAYQRLTKDNKSAGVRSRKNTLTLEKLFKEWRKVTVAE